MAASSPSPSPPQTIASAPRLCSRSKPLVPPPPSAEAVTPMPPSPPAAAPPAVTPLPPSPKAAPSALSSTPPPHARELSTPLLPSPAIAPSPHSSSKASTSLPWYWAIEALADCKRVDTSVLKALLRNAPDFSTGAPGPVKERVALRCLEELVGLDRGEIPPDWASTVGIDVSQSCEEVLCREMGKFCQITSFFNLQKDRVNLLTHDLQKFIIEKRNSLPKSSLDKIKESIVQENCPALMSFCEDYGFPIENEVAHPQCNLVDAKSQRVDNFKVSLQDAEIESLKPSSSVAPDNCIALLQEEHPGSMQQFLKENVAGVDRTLKRSNFSTGGNDQLSDGFTENERVKKIRLSTENCQLQSIDKDLGVLAPISNTCVSPEDLSEPMDDVFKKNVEDAGTVSTGVDNVRTTGQGLQNVEFAETLSNGVDVQTIRQGSISKEPDPGKTDAFGDEQCLPNALNGDKNSHVCNDIFAKVNDPADLVKGAFVNKKGKLQHAPTKGHGENSHPALSEKNHFNLNILQGMVRDDNSPDVPSNVDTGEDAFVGEGHSTQVNKDNDSVIYARTERGLCIKCKKGGEMLICCGSGCLISVHKACLGALPKFDISGLFFCPFCSYERAAIAYRKEKDKFYRACKLLSDFTGRDFVQGHQREWSPLRVLTEEIQMRDSSNSCSELNVGLNRCTKDKLNVTLIEENEQTYHQEVVQSYDICKSPCREAEALGNETSHHSAEVNDDKVVDEVTYLTHHSNADPSNQEIVPHNNGEQVDFLEHQLPGERSNNDHLAFKEDPCHARYVHDVVQGDIVLINENLHMQQMKYQKEKKDQCTIGEESPGGKNGNGREQDKMVVDDRHSNMTTPGKPGMPKFRVKRYFNPILPPKRRNKLSWTAEEEECLKEAINELGANYNGPIPWVNILEHGRHVFHKTRQPGDLKDKWRNMKRKAASSATTS